MSKNPSLLYNPHSGEILENNIKLAGILQPTPVQMYSTSIVKNGRDLMACAQTGNLFNTYILPSNIKYLHFNRDVNTWYTENLTKYGILT